jgi:hypothetical protein
MSSTAPRSLAKMRSVSPVSRVPQPRHPLREIAEIVDAADCGHPTSPRSQPIEQNAPVRGDPASRELGETAREPCGLLVAVPS